MDGISNFAARGMEAQAGVGPTYKVFSDITLYARDRDVNLHRDREVQASRAPR